MAVPLYQVDAFTDRPFSGNPAAVCLLAEAAHDDWMQEVAAEMNLSETAFLLPEADGWRLRWFTPVLEVELCGHATLASAHVLWETGRLAADEPARFHTRSGLLTAERDGGLIDLDFPTLPPSECPAPEGLVEALGVSVRWVGTNRSYFLVEVADESLVRGLAPDMERLAKLPALGFIVTSRSDTSRYDFVSRFFAPAGGIAEDPVTGSAHCYLGPYWGERLGKKDLRAYQASARGGEIRVRLRGDRVRLGGSAVTVMRGELLA